MYVCTCVPCPPVVCVFVRVCNCVCVFAREIDFFFVLTAIQVGFDGFSDLVLSTGLVIVSHVQLLS